MNKLEAIKAMLEGKKVRRKVWFEGEYIYLDKYGNIVNNEGNIEEISGYDFDGWEIYKPKKEKVDLYLYAVKDKYGTWKITKNFYKSEKECKNDYFDYLIDRCIDCIRLDWSKITVEVEEEEEDD